MKKRVGITLVLLCIILVGATFVSANLWDWFTEKQGVTPGLTGNPVYNGALLGDVDGSGEVNSLDLGWLTDIVFNKNYPDNFCDACSDVNFDGKLNSDDINLIKDYLFVGGTFPIPNNSNCEDSDGGRLCPK